MGWIIFFDILLIIVIALILSVTVCVRIDDEIRIKIKYAGITIFSVSPEEESRKKEKKKNKQKIKKSEQSAEKVAKAEPANQAKQENQSHSDKGSVKNNTEQKKTEQEKEKSEKKGKALSGNDFSEKWEMIKALTESAGKPVKRLISHIRVNDLSADITASGDDACEAALNYGKINWLIHSTLAFLYQTVRLNVKRINIGVDFTSGNTEYYISCKIKMRLSTAIGCAIWFLARAAKRILKNNSQNGPEPSKTAVRQKGT